MRTRAKQLAFLTGLLIAGIFLWLALREVDFSLVAANFAAAKLHYIPMCMAALAAFYVLKAVRWGQLLAPDDPIAAARLMPSMMVGFAGNNVLPLRLGELIRVLLAAEDLRSSRSKILATVVLERLLDVVSILVVLLVATGIGGESGSELRAARGILVAGAAVALVTVYCALFPPRPLTALLRAVVGRLPPRIAAAITDRTRFLQDGFAALRSSGMLLKLLANSLLQWLLIASCVWFSLLAFDIEVPPSAAVIVLTFVTVGIAIPGAPGFVGTIEYAFVAALGLFSVDASTAISAGIFYHTIGYCCTTLTGALYLRRYRLSWSELRSRAEDSKVEQ